MQDKPSIIQLENFIIYGKYRNFLKAAKEANITQSAFSFQMKNLENILGIKLINRNNRGSMLTKEGEIFLEKLIPIMEDLDKLFLSINTQKENSINIRLGTLMSCGDVLMNRHLIPYKKHHPNIKFSVYNLEAKNMLKKLEDEEIDVATTFILPQMNIEKYEKQFCFKEELVYYAPKLSILKDTVTEKDIALNTFASYSPEYFMSKMIIDHFKNLNRDLTIEANLSTPYAIMHYCQQNPCGSLLSKHLLNEMNIFTGYYSLENPFFIDCFILYKKANPNIKEIIAFAKFLRNAFLK